MLWAAAHLFTGKGAWEAQIPSRTTRYENHFSSKNQKKEKQVRRRGGGKVGGTGLGESSTDSLTEMAVSPLLGPPGLLLPTALVPMKPLASSYLASLDGYL